MATKEVERVRVLYNYICNRAQEEEGSGFIICSDKTIKRVQIIEELEKLTGREFKNTAEFHHHVSDFLMKNGHPGSLLKECRKERGISQHFLALKLGVGQQYVAKMENGTKPLIPKALDFIKETKKEQRCEKSIELPSQG